MQKCMRFIYNRAVASRHSGLGLNLGLKIQCYVITTLDEVTLRSRNSLSRTWYHRFLHRWLRPRPGWTAIKPSRLRL